MTEQTEQQQTADPQTTELSPTDRLRIQELKKGNLPSQRIRIMHAEMLDQRLTHTWERISKEKLKPSCDPQTLTITKQQVAMSLAQDPNQLMAAILRWFDDCYLFQGMVSGLTLEEATPPGAPSPDPATPSSPDGQAATTA